MRFEAVVRAIIEKDEKILFVKRAKKPEKNKWCLPGGRVKFRERVEDSIKRETKEELNLRFHPIFYHHKEDFDSVKDVHCFVFYFSGTIEGQLKVNEDEILEIKFFDINDLSKYKIGFDHKKIIEKYFKDIVRIDKIKI